METVERPYHGVKTEQIVQDMLKERVDSCLVDSGSIYGRAWERNVGKDLSLQPDVWGTFRAVRPADSELAGKLEVSGTVSLYHFLVNNLAFAPEVQARFDEFCEEECTSPLQAAQDYAQHLVELGLADEWSVAYTYNDPSNCDLSQNIQYVHVRTDTGRDLLLVSVHGGCDARWGFSYPRAFYAGGYWEEVLDQMKAKVVGCDHSSWSLDFWDRAEPSETSEVREELSQIPAYDLSWVSNDEIKALQWIVGGAERTKALVECTTLRQEAVELAKKTIDYSVAAYEQLRRDLIVELLNQQHETFFICHDENAWLFTGDLGTLSCFDEGSAMQFYM